MSGFNPGSVVFGKCMISGSGGSVDISRRIRKVSVFENILKPYTTIQLTIEDTTDILNHNVGLNGNNTLAIAFSQPQQPQYSGTFTITTAEKSRTTQNQRVVQYDMVGYSRHMTKMPVVEKSYRFQTATDIARDLISSFLGPDKGIRIGDPSRGILGNQHMPYNINGLPIHKAIRSVLERAASSANKASLYTYFEDNKDFVVDTLDNLLNKSLSSPIATYYQRPMGQSWPLDLVRQQFNILGLKENSRVDATSQNIMKNQKVQPFDIFTNKSESKGSGGATNILNIFYDILRPPTYAAETMPDKAARAADFDSQSVTIHVPLNTALTVGKGFAIDTLAPAGDTSTPVRDKLSGSLMAMEVRHSVDLGNPKIQGTTTVRGTRGGL